MNIFFFLMFVFVVPTIYFDGISSSYHTVFKFLSSLCFILCGYISYKKSSNNRKYCFYILIGLLFGLLGDVLLSLTSSKAFILGVIAFAIGHLLFIRGFTIISSISKSNLIMTFIIFICFITFIIRSGYFNFNGMLPAVFIYGFIIIFMLSTAIDLFKFRKVNKFNTYLVVIGAILFVISDFILLFVKFYPNAPSFLTSFNLITYYAGQGLIASSLSKNLVDN